MGLRWDSVMVLFLVVLFIFGMMVFFLPREEYYPNYLKDWEKADLFKMKAISAALALAKPDMEFDCSFDAPASELYVEFQPQRVKTMEKVDPTCVDQYTYTIQKIAKSDQITINEQILKDNGCYVTSTSDTTRIWKCPTKNCKLKEVVTYDVFSQTGSGLDSKAIVPKYLKLMGLENLNCKIHMSAGK
jgi:hypothetical protein